MGFGVCLGHSGYCTAIPRMLPGCDEVGWFQDVCGFLWCIRVVRREGGTFRRDEDADLGQRAVGRCLRVGCPYAILRLIFSYRFRVGAYGFGC